ncbi:MAG: hypothetical protein COA77_07540 [Thaumarchaeota archaeon]|nr:MAG: hypothetical protein COA77_07540 [Nitrososphaerota archaeon]
MTCKGTCTKHKAIKPSNSIRYGIGQKMCSICEIFINWNGKYCPCCNYMLRTKPRRTKTRQKLLMIQQIKRI